MLAGPHDPEEIIASVDKGIGVCGKEGQGVPVGVGMPTVKLDRLTVGGTAGWNPYRACSC